MQSYLRIIIWIGRMRVRSFNLFFLENQEQHPKFLGAVMALNILSLDVLETAYGRKRT